MKHPLIILLLGALFAVAPVLSAQSAPMSMDAGMMGSDGDCEECVDHENCNDQSDMQDCMNACQSICAAAGSHLAITDQRQMELFPISAVRFETDAGGLMSGAFAASDVPPPRI